MSYSIDELMLRLDVLARRFQGVDVSYRATPARWVAKNVCNSVDYRVAGEGQTPEEAIRGLLVRIDEVDEQARRL